MDARAVFWLGVYAGGGASPCSSSPWSLRLKPAKLLALSDHEGADIGEGLVFGRG